MASPVALGFRVQRGGAVVVGVATGAAGPRVVRNSVLATAEEGDRLAFEPYHVAYEMAGPDRAATPEIAAAVEEGRRRQAQLAATALDDVLGGLRKDGFEPAVAALLVNRAGWMSDLLAHALSAPEHPAVMEGLAVREALRAAFASQGLETVELDEKTLAETAWARLPLPPAAQEATLKALGDAAGRPWRKEQKQAALAAWLAIAGSRS